MNIPCSSILILPRKYTVLVVLNPLILCDTNHSPKLKCSACRLPFEDGLAYVCLECNFSLHKSCAALPPRSHHPFHPQHPLVLRYPQPYIGNSFYCGACGDRIRGFNYTCEVNPVNDCFEMCLRCVSIVPTVKSTLHEHPLALIDVKQTRLKCMACGTCTARPSFCCVICEFTVHVHCSAILPHRVKTDCHRHALKFTNSKIRDYSDEDDDAEFYCDACEERRNLSESTYYCEECHFVAHTDCIEVISEVHELLKEESNVVWKPEDCLNIAQPMFDKTVKSIREMIEREQEHLKKREAEIELWKIKLEEVKKERVECLADIMLDPLLKG